MGSRSYLEVTTNPARKIFEKVAAKFSHRHFFPLNFFPADVRPFSPAYLIDDADLMQKSWFVEKATIGVTAGASAPESLVQAVVQRLCEWGAQLVQEMQGREESIVFALPKELRQ